MAFRKSQVYLSLVNSYLIDSPQPSTLNYWYNLGSLLGLCLIIQICSGIFLAMHYSSHIDLAFASIEHIMRDVNYGYLIRYIHANGASFFFTCMYLHIGKALYYGSYKSPRVLVWIIGVIIFVVTMATAFLGKKQTQHCPKLIINKNFYYKSNKSYTPFDLKQSHRSIHINSKQDITTPEEIFKELNIILKNYWENLHLSSTRNNIAATVKNKSGVYIIINKITRNYYIGSATTNRLYIRFSNHCYHNHGSKTVYKSIDKYGLNNFIFGILEYYPDIINKNNNLNLLNLEQTYISLMIPTYNILTEAHNSFGYKHLDETKLKMKSLFTEERKELLRQLQINRKGKWSQESKDKITQSNIKNSSHIKLNTKEQLIKRSDRFSKIIYLKNYNTNIYICEFKNISKMHNYICCSEKTIRRALKVGHIYIPINYIPYLNNTLISKFNNVKENNLNLTNSIYKSSIVGNNISIMFKITRELK